MAKKKEQPATSPAPVADQTNAAPADGQATTATPAAAVQPEPAPVVKDVRNGIARPKNGSKTGRVWEIADSISGASGKPAERKPVFEACAKEGINPATTATQFGLWRGYYGLVSKRGPRQPKAADPAAPAAAAGGAADGQGAAVE